MKRAVPSVGVGDGGIKYTRFNDIPKRIASGSWECGFPLDRVWRQVAEWQREYQLDIDPDFQRLHVWTERQQIAWMEYLLSGGKTGRTIYFNCAAWGRAPGRDPHMVLVDGKQRLEAIRRFYADEIRVYGSLRSEYADSPDMLRGGLMLFNVHDLPTRADVLKWYCQMNAGGTPHTEAEIARVCRLWEQERVRELGGRK